MYLAINLVADRRIVAIGEDKEETKHEVRHRLENEGASGGEIRIAVYSLVVNGQAVDVGEGGTVRVK